MKQNLLSWSNSFSNWIINNKTKTFDIPLSDLVLWKKDENIYHSDSLLLYL